MRVLVVGATGAIGGRLVRQLPEAVRKRRYPVVGDGSGMMSFVHLDDAAAAAVLALDHEGPAIYNVTDDEPAATRDWLPALAIAVGARPPRHVPAWLGRLIMGAGLDMMTGARASRRLTPPGTRP